MKHTKHQPNSSSRRRFFQFGAGAAGGASALWLGKTHAAQGDDDPHAQLRAARGARESLDKATAFLSFMLDAYQQGATLRLVQSYSDQQTLGSTAFTYDNALAILALLYRKKRDDLARARLLGDSFLYAQANDPNYSDGRLRQGYYVGPFDLGFARTSEFFIRADGKVNLVGEPFFFVGSAVGDMAWAAIALAQLHAFTRDARYLDGAVKLGRWIIDNAYETRGLGGYTFGVDGNNNRLLFKSTEHNIDVYGLFTNLLAPLTGDRTWVEFGQHALSYAKTVWNTQDEFFFTGSGGGDADLIEGIPESPLQPPRFPEDPQSWSYLALLDNTYAASIDWAKTNLATTDTPQSRNASFKGNLRFSGVTFSNFSLNATEPPNQFDAPPSADAVWFEGTAHMAAALFARKLPPNRDLPTFYGDVATALTYLDNIRWAQDVLGKGQTAGGKAIPEGNGVVAASSPLNTGYGFSYFPNLHVGATSWYLIAALLGNPFQLGRRG
jgi:hypothetical protein